MVKKFTDATELGALPLRDLTLLHIINACPYEDFEQYSQELAIGLPTPLIDGTLKALVTEDNSKLKESPKCSKREKEPGAASDKVSQQSLF